MTDPVLDAAGDPARPHPPASARRLGGVLVAGALLNAGAMVTTVVAGAGSLDAADVAEQGALAGTGIPGPALAATVVGFAVVLGLIEAGLWLLGGRLLVRGYAWARWTATVLGVTNLAVEAARAGGPGPAVGRAFAAAEILVVVAALVLLWSPAVSRYVAAVSRWRAVAAV
ncbi:MAG: hypothetical protein ACFCVG_11955 [Kineosporiaceae bacterium]